MSLSWIVASTRNPFSLYLLNCTTLGSRKSFFLSPSPLLHCYEISLSLLPLPVRVSRSSLSICLHLSMPLPVCFFLSPSMPTSIYIFLHLSALLTFPSPQPLSKVVLWGFVLVFWKSWFGLSLPAIIWISGPALTDEIWLSSKRMRMRTTHWTLKSMVDAFSLKICIACSV